MTRQLLLGIVFLVLGILIMLVMLFPMAMLAAHGTPITITVLALTLLAIGIGVALFGAWLIPSSGAPVAFQQLTVAISKSGLPFTGRDRRSASDTSVTATVTSTAEAPKDIELPPPEKMP